MAIAIIHQKLLKDFVALETTSAKPHSFITEPSVMQNITWGEHMPTETLPCPDDNDLTWHCRSLQEVQSLCYSGCMEVTT